MSTEPTEPDTRAQDQPGTGEPTSLARAGNGAETRPAEHRPAPPAPARRPVPVAANGRPASPAELRREIERTRARMSDTLDVLEAKIERRQAALQQRKQKVVDGVTLKRVREKMAEEPWRSLAIAFAAGYIIAAIRD